MGAESTHDAEELALQVEIPNHSNPAWTKAKVALEADHPADELVDRLVVLVLDPGLDSETDE